MRTTLLELPILMCCLWGGLLAGLIAALLRLFGQLKKKRLAGRRLKLVPRALIGILDALAALVLGVLCAAALIYANGGEPRAYAVISYASGAALTMNAVLMLAGVRGRP